MEIFLCVLFLFLNACNISAQYIQSDNNSKSQQQTGQNRYIVGYKNALGSAAAQAAASEVNVHLNNYNAVAVTILTQAALNELRNNPNIEYIEEDALRYSMGDPKNFLRGIHHRDDVGVDQSHRHLVERTPYGIVMVQADQVDDVAEDSKKICIIDSGYSRDHPDLPDSESVTGEGSEGIDLCSHGTHVAGTIAAIGDNGIGVVGVTQNTALHIVKVFDGTNCEWSYSSTLIAALEECTGAGADVVSMSLGGGSPTSAEETAFDDAYINGVISIAAAGNDGNMKKNYPASYDSVVSVGALDKSEVIADFSQTNDQVELAAPGVGVLSTVYAIVPNVTDDDADEYIAGHIEFSGTNSVQSTLVDCGFGELGCEGALGNICLIGRGDTSFDEKVTNCETDKGVAAIIYNNVPGSFSGTLGESTSATIPAVSISQGDGELLMGKIDSKSLNVTVNFPTSPVYSLAYYDGTSMATPHVSGVAALVWSHCPGCANTEIRQALQNSAEDLGDNGKDDTYGYGLVQAKDALDYLKLLPCCEGSEITTTATTVGTTTAPPLTTTGPDCLPRGVSCSVDGDCCSLKCRGGGQRSCK